MMKQLEPLENEASARNCSKQQTDTNYEITREEKLRQSKDKKRRERKGWIKLYATSSLTN